MTLVYGKAAAAEKNRGDQFQRHLGVGTKSCDYMTDEMWESLPGKNPGEHRSGRGLDMQIHELLICRFQRQQ